MTIPRLESGMIVPVVLIAFAISTVDSNRQAIPIFAALLPQIYALAPLLIMVRVGLGLSIETEDVMTLHAGTMSEEIEFRATVPTDLTLADQNEAPLHSNSETRLSTVDVVADLHENGDRKSSLGCGNEHQYLRV
ncbi:hypothetical protein VNI00_007032 [Paramarasmius palmivorus]|uniref:Uncharacterized protein n=1 Tax=Paramarasmius palmivorus TaxID=297713 RepID=A0AAW0D4H2_9AGAR